MAPTYSFPKTQDQSKDEIVAEAALVAGDETEDDGLRSAIPTVLYDDALFDDGLIDLALDLAQGPTQARQWHHDLRWHQRGPQPFDDHQLEAVLPLVLGDARGQHLSLEGMDKMRNPLLDHIPVGGPEGQGQHVSRGQSH